ncbi:MAG: nucleotidyl transferase AbiEii/AbiGii toxin family protein, partial [bacterium]|nr:nucleotidyl transferase AbiEii/AbiGii toxin family protein [bacterium]
MEKLKLFILSESRKKILLTFVSWKNEFYLAGGTGLALQIGHRDSVDFDFFTKRSFDTSVIIEKLSKLFDKVSFTVTQVEKNTVSILLQSEIKISFMTYDYELLNPLIQTEYMNIASISDIACMKLSTIMQRSSLKDYVDLYEIMKIYSLDQLLLFAKKKYPIIDLSVILKSLSYFEDIVDEPLIYQDEKTQPSLDEIIHFFQNEVKKYILKTI